MIKTDLDRIKAGISFFKLMKGKEDNSLVLKYFWSFLSLVEFYINGGEPEKIEETPATFEEAKEIFNPPEQLPITI